MSSRRRRRAGGSGRRRRKRGGSGWGVRRLAVWVLPEEYQCWFSCVFSAMLGSTANSCSYVVFDFLLVGRDRHRHRQWLGRSAGFAGCDALRDVFFLVNECPWCSVSLSVWTKSSLIVRSSLTSGSGMCSSGFSWCCVLRCVSFCCRQAQDACHHGRYGPKGTLRGENVVHMPVLCNNRCRGFRSAENCGFSAVAAHQQGR